MAGWLALVAPVEAGGGEAGALLEFEEGAEPGAGAIGAAGAGAAILPMVPVLGEPGLVMLEAPVPLFVGLFGAVEAL